MITKEMFREGNLHRMPGKKRNFLFLLKFTFVAGSVLSPTQASARVIQSNPTTPASKPGKSVQPITATECEKHTLLDATSPSRLKAWVNEDRTFTKDEATDLILSEGLPVGSIFMITENHDTMVCRVIAGHNYEVLLWEFPIDAFSTLVLKRTLS